MSLKYLGGSLPRGGVYTISFGTLSRLPTGSWQLSSATVTSVDLVTAGKAYSYASGGAGIVAGGLVAGPLGAAVGGLLPKAFKDDEIHFRILFRDGNVAHFTGSKSEYRRALTASYKGASQQPPSPNPTGTASELDALRAEVAELRAALGGQSPAPAVEPPPLSPEDLEQERVREGRGMTPEEKAARLSLPVSREGSSPRLWLLGEAERKYITASPGESSAERRRRESQNEKFRKEYRTALKRVLEEQKKAIYATGLSFKEKLRLIGELEEEFRARTGR